MEGIPKGLMEGPDYVRYNTMINLMGLQDGDENVRKVRYEMMNDPGILSLLEECRNWPGSVLKRHNDAKLLVHKLAFLSEIGVGNDDDPIHEISEKIMKDPDDDGPFRVLAHLYERFGGSGKDEMAWFLCDSPLLIYSLAKFGYGKDERIIKARDHLLSLIDENGWRCHASKELGRFRGPGGSELECPYATLLMLRMISAFPDLKGTREARIGINTILDLWSDRKKRKPFLFAMGTDFRKLKAPLIWYDILHVTEVLTRFEIARNDERTMELTDIIRSKSDDAGMFTPESVWMAWKGWDFSQKKQPSPWISYRAYRIMKRIDSI